MILNLFILKCRLILFETVTYVCLWVWKHQWRVRMEILVSDREFVRPWICLCGYCFVCSFYLPCSWVFLITLDSLSLFAILNSFLTTGQWTLLAPLKTNPALTAVFSRQEWWHHSADLAVKSLSYTLFQSKAGWNIHIPLLCVSNKNVPRIWPMEGYKI